MRYVLALFVPPLAVLLCGKLFQTLLSVVLTAACSLGILATAGVLFPLWLIPVIHAWAVIGGHKSDVRTDKVVRAIERTSRHG